MGFFDSLFGGGHDSAADELRRQEEERQRRIREGTNAINEIFGGAIYGQTPVSVNRPGLPAPVTPARPTLPLPALPGQNRALPEVTRPRFFVQGQSQSLPWTKIRDAKGQFGDDWFDNIERDYLDYYLPQFEKQASDAERALKINLSRSGNIGGSVGARDVGRLAETRESEYRRLIDEATKYSMGERKKLEDTRGNLIGQLEAGAGIENVAGQAAAQARAMTAPPAFSPLGDLFKNYTAAVANASLASGQPGFPGAEDYRRALLFNIPSGKSSGSSYTVN